MSNISPVSTAAVTAANKPTAKPSSGTAEPGAAKSAAPASSAIVSLSAEGLSKAAADSGKDATPSSARA